VGEEMHGLQGQVC